MILKNSEGENIKLQTKLNYHRLDYYKLFHLPTPLAQKPKHHS